MNIHTIGKLTVLRAALLALSFTSALVACSGGSDGDSSIIGGVAAVGAPISGATIDLACNSYNGSATTAANGSWSASVPSGSLPCLSTLTGGTFGVGGAANPLTLHSVADAVRLVANLTPLTELVLARAALLTTGLPLSDWAGNGSTVPARMDDVIAATNAARAAARTAFTAAGYAWPSESFDPFNGAISPGSPTDAYDQLLDRYGDAIAAAVSESRNLQQAYLQALTNFAQASTPAVPAPPGTSQPPTGESPDTTLASNENGVRFETTGKVLGNTESHALRYWPGPGTVNTGSTAGVLNEVTINGPQANSYLNFRDLPDAVGTYDCGYSSSATPSRNIEMAFAVSNGYNSTGTRGANGFTTGFRCSITLTRVGTRSGSTYSGVIEGSFDVQLFKTGQAVNLPDSISVSGHFRIGAASTTPVTPPAAGASLAAMIGNAFQGTYVLNCGASGQQRIVMNADGTSSVNGVPAADATHPGVVATRSNIFESERRAEDQGSGIPPSYSVIFNSDGSVSAGTVLLTVGAAPTICTAVSGARPNAAAYANQAMALFARTQTLSCPGTASLAAGPTTFTIAADGGVTLGSLGITAAQYLETKNYTFTDAHTFLLRTSAPFFYPKSAVRVSNNTLTFVVTLDPVTRATVQVDYVNGFERGVCTP